MTTWDTERAARRAEQAYRYVSRTLLPVTDYSPLDTHTAAAYKAERTGNWPAFLEALAELCRTARGVSRPPFGPGLTSNTKDDERRAD